jgi:hypothetical protein
MAGGESTRTTNKFANFAASLPVSEWRGSRHHSYAVPSRGKSSAWSRTIDGKWSAVGLADALSKYAGSIRQAPSGKSNHSWNDFGHSFDLQEAVSHCGVEKREILEVIRSPRNDPEVGRGVIDHSCDHAAEAKVKACLHHHQHHRKNDAHEGGDKAKPILEKISQRKRKNEWHISEPQFALKSRTWTVKSLQTHRQPQHGRRHECVHYLTCNQYCVWGSVH